MKTFMAELEQHLAVIDKLRLRADAVEAAGELLMASLRQGGKILLCGNGGSAADSQHIAAEFVVRYEKRRRALAAIALTTDTSILTAHTNDYDFDSVFARQVEALGHERDCLIAISTSGRSKNVLRASEAALALGMPVIGLTGCGGGELAAVATVSVIVPDSITARIQEAHILIGHWWCGLVEEAFCDSQDA